MTPSNILDRSSNVKRKMHDRTRNPEYLSSYGGVRFSSLKPSDWGIGMTICIAAICENGNAVVAAYDRLMSSFSSSSDSLQKGHRVHSRWLALFSGDVCQAEPVLRRIEDRLIGKPGTPDDVEGVFTEVYADEVRREAERTVLAPVGLTMAQYLAGASPTLHREIHLGLKAGIEQVRLDCQFLVFGFGPKSTDEAGLFMVCSNAEKAVNLWRFDRVGAWAIGSGGDTARAMLGFHRYGPATSRHLAAYLVCEAKFMAESAQGVGDRTWLIEMDAQGKLVVMGEPVTNRIRKFWLSQGAPRIPSGTENEMGKILSGKEEN